MQKQEKLADVMKYERILPENFSGIFTFTNYTNEEFIGIWGGVEYPFPPLTTSPMIMPFSPLEIQNIRKKFAKDLAEREFFKSKEYKTLAKQEGTPGNRTLNSIFQAGQYSEYDLIALIKRALEPMPEGKVVPRIQPKVALEDIMHVDAKTGGTTKAISTDAELAAMSVKA